MKDERTREQRLVAACATFAEEIHNLFGASAKADIEVWLDRDVLEHVVGRAIAQGQFKMRQTHDHGVDSYEVAVVNGVELRPYPSERGGRRG